MHSAGRKKHARQLPAQRRYIGNVKKQYKSKRS